tara:strand:+ start:321 stop:593 length:273 start_codon:yes stop_codon:yes gene_type:complete
MIEWLRNFFRGFNTVTFEEPEPDSFIEELVEKGCHYNEEEDWYERTWLVATKTGAETSKEVYVKNDEGWKVVMYGNTGDVFFEHKVNGTE